MVYANVALIDFRKNKSTVESGFYAFQGLIYGIILNDLWRLLKLPGEDVPVENASFDWDYVIQVGIAGAVILSEKFFKVKNGGAVGAGMFLGSTFANTSEGRHKDGNKYDKSRYIGFIN